MNRIRPFLVSAAALAVTAGMTVLPALTSATPASAVTVSNCAGTSLARGFFSDLPMRVPTVINAHPAQWRCNLPPGSTGSPVARLQIDLNACYKAGLQVDGDYGPLTERAVKNVQRSEHVTVDGEYGPQTASHGFRYLLAPNSGGAGCDYITTP
jgi:peptidoglycan hydrolase-like protein with peptidoglycan-binding domain